MKKIVLVLVAMALMVGTTQANLLTNPGFEDGAFGSGTPDDWYTYYSATGAISLTWVNTTAHADNKCVRLQKISDGTTWYCGYWMQEVDVTALAEYSVSVWVKNETAGQSNKIYAGLIWDIGGSDYISAYVDTTDWAKYDFASMTAPAGAVSAAFYLCHSSSVPLGNTILLDDASLVPEPVTIGLLGLGMLMLRRRKKA